MAICLVMIVSVHALAQQTSAFKKALAVGDTAPNFVSTNPDGEKVSSRQMARKHRLLLLHFWYPDSQNVLAVQTIRKVHEAYKDSGFNVLSVNTSGDSIEWNKTIYRESMDWRNVSSLPRLGVGPEAELYGVKYIAGRGPAILLLDRSGKILAVDIPQPDTPYNGLLIGDRLFDKVQELLAEQEK